MGKATIDVLSHKVTIERISAQLADTIWHRKDYLNVWISFEPHVENIISTGIELPVKNYGKDEFVQAVKDAVQKLIPEMQARYQKEQEERRQKDKRQEDLDSLAKQLETMISA